MKKSSHDSLVHRLAQMLIKLNQGEKLEPQVLADEFNVNLRTVQRDLNERLAYLPIKKENGLYRLEEFYLGKISKTDIHNFAAIAGIKGLFPNLGNDFLSNLLDATINQAYLVKGHHYENSQIYQHLFSPLEMAINQRKLVSFRYTYKPRITAPYRLLSSKGIWYLAAVENDKLKSFRLAEISSLEVLPEGFDFSSDISAIVQNEDGIWFSSDKCEVVLKIASNIAHYFERRQLIPSQKIDKTLEDGSLIISSRIASDAQILPIIRYWMPHIRIISPENLQTKLQNGLKNYLSADG